MDILPKFAPETARKQDASALAVLTTDNPLAAAAAEIPRRATSVAVSNPRPNKTPMEKARHVWNEAHFAGAAPKIARAGISARCRRKYHPGGSVAGLGEFSAKSVGYCDRGDHQEDGHKHRNRVACAIKISAGHVGDFFDQNPSCTEWRRVKSITNSVEQQRVATVLVALG